MNILFVNYMIVCWTQIIYNNNKFVGGKRIKPLTLIVSFHSIAKKYVRFSLQNTVGKLCGRQKAIKQYNLYFSGTTIFQLFPLFSSVSVFVIELSPGWESNPRHLLKDTSEEDITPSPPLS